MKNIIIFFLNIFRKFFPEKQRSITITQEVNIPLGESVPKEKQEIEIVRDMDIIGERPADWSFEQYKLYLKRQKAFLKEKKKGDIVYVDNSGFRSIDSELEFDSYEFDSYELDNISKSVKPLTSEEIMKFIKILRKKV